MGRVGNGRFSFNDQDSKHTTAEFSIHRACHTMEVSCLICTYSTRYANIHSSVKSETVRNVASARVSVPSLVVEDKDGKYKWRTDLTKTAPFWTGMVAPIITIKTLLLTSMFRVVHGPIQQVFRQHGC